MIPEALQPRALLAPPRDLASHFRTLIAADSSMENLTFIDRCVLDQIHTEAIPSSVYEVWLSLACRYTPLFTVAALTKPSRGVRLAARHCARRLFLSSHWKERGWDFLGGAQGIKGILDILPLKEARLLLKIIFGRCQAIPDGKVVSVCVEEFLDLVEATDPWLSRSLLPHVSHLYAYCSAERVEDMLRSQSPKCPELLKYTSRFHTPLLRRIAIGKVDMPEEVRRKTLQQCQTALLNSKEPYDPIYYQDVQLTLNLSPGLLFGMDLLTALEREPEILRSHLSRALSRDIVQFWSISRFGGVKGTHEGLVAQCQKRRRLKDLSAYQIELEDCLIKRVLQVQDESFQNQGKNRRQFSETLNSLIRLVNIRGRKAFLQLLCRHCPTMDFDLTTWPPSQREQELMPCWDLDVLDRLRPDDSESLFGRSLHIYHCEEFLPSFDSRNPELKMPSWEAQCLLWASWESASPERNGFPITLKALGDMKQKSVRAREPAERLRWAISAVKLAARTSSIDIFAEIVEWTSRYIRDALVFPDLMYEIIDRCPLMLSCRAATQGEASVPRSDLEREAQTGHKIMEGLLKTCLLLLREPWARSSVSRITGRICNMFSAIVSRRMESVRDLARGESFTECELAEILLDPIIPVLMEYERQGNIKGQTDVRWSGPTGLLLSPCLFPRAPTLLELSFMDRLAKARDEFWQQHRSQHDPDVVKLSPGLPRGLAIQHLVYTSDWLYQVMKHPDHAPFLSSRANEVLFGAADTVMHAMEDKEAHVDGFVDCLGFIVRALLANDNPADRNRDVLRVWEHYSEILKPYPDYLGLFQDWLAAGIRHREHIGEALDTIQPPGPCLAVTPRISAVPSASEIDMIEWDPQDGDYPPSKKPFKDMKETLDKIPCTVLNCRMERGIPSQFPYVYARKPPAQPTPEYLSIWSPASDSQAKASQGSSHCIQESVVLAALLFLDTHTKDRGILRARFPDVDCPRYPPIRLAESFIASQTRDKLEKALSPPIDALRRSARRVPSQILRNLILSFLDTLEAEPNSPTYSALLFSTFDLIEILLSTDEPQLAVDIMIRVWKDFPGESSFHRKISLVKLGRVLFPEQGRKLMSQFAGYVCDALQAQQGQNQQQPKEKKGFIKVTTAKMLAQALAEADFLSQAGRMEILRKMFSSARHVDIRREIVNALLNLVGSCENPEPYKVFASIVASVAGPNERAATTEVEWEMAENPERGGPLPYVAPLTERPVLNSAFSAAFWSIPEKLRPEYVENVLLPLLQESSRQHTRWIAAMAARLGLSLSDLNITEDDIGPFIPDLTNKILWRWAEYLPESFLQQFHRPWALSYLHYESFARIDSALAVTAEAPLKDSNVRDHWENFFASLCGRPALYSLEKLLSPFVNGVSKAPNGLNTALILEEFEFCAELVIRNPVKYNRFFKKYILHPEYTLEPFRALRESRLKSVSDVKDSADKARIYHDLTDAMARLISVCETVRREGWSAAAYPVTLPSQFEYHVLLLPSPIYNPSASETHSAAEIFTSALVDLIIKYSADPTLLLKLDSFQSVLREIPSADLKACMLRLGCVWRELEKHDPIVICIRVKLALSLLDIMRSDKGFFKRDVDILGMIEEWKKSDVEFVRQIGWEVELL
ncbi:hypothetical protein AN9371.2 [Aspergillus nidulans FGSC A4]|uniref:Uncharacterized protein n=1 Tax=Emericella nidulans (strain FGSC A4 / ATCC 38163 / CBS 112.46 / NRRL 194 / M139) TaxID=227321 RepID=Q5AQQ9_EMENI|nr:hypothetical protein [Aspergillus nidulans FGSC A4]EAA66438.1 hypothetical protein AN9371.2 [Aspergillus nidulans FGSC A4]CBF87489.1 TPA: conserved hypothetical protein [Aspergillus nidulans FGSC A4]|eukprot:XP_682640.1 hypothetical protein AN9371.2 [Aspergillus nidulans FGSC A4]